ncbi:MAG: hypothetical protein AMXMBFR78_07540 [Rubrivivax sp.]|jgi:AbrB family looped-hinge helix DNA binding protein|nr:AbrB/MazE/SpoVT family DNA-binding domain-containing protein [Rubrivivax sp.]
MIMPTLLVSSKGQIVLPAALRRRLGMGAGARLEMLEEPDGLKLRVVRSVEPADVTELAGMLQAPSRGTPRRLQDFDAASLLSAARAGLRQARPSREASQAAEPSFLESRSRGGKR